MQEKGEDRLKERLSSPAFQRFLRPFRNIKLVGGRVCLETELTFPSQAKFKAPTIDPTLKAPPNVGISICRYLSKRQIL